MEPEPKKTGRFGKGNPGKPKGAVTKGSVLIRDMVANCSEQIEKDLCITIWEGSYTAQKSLTA
jgi:hypothetical protein